MVFLFLQMEPVIPVSIRVLWISIDWAEDTQAELELDWQDSIWTTTFDGHEVDLPEFGTHDWELDGQPTLSWNVCISNPATGKQPVSYEREFFNGVDLGKWHNILTFTGMKFIQSLRLLYITFALQLYHADNKISKGV